MKLTRASIFFLILIFAGYPVFSQDETPKLTVDGLKNRKYIASAMMLADLEFLKPETMSFGLSVNAYFRILNKPKLKNTAGSKFAERELFVKPEFGFIYRRHYHTGIFFVPSLAFRNTSPKGIFVEINADAGYYYAKLNAPVYELQPDGTMQKIRAGFSNVIIGGKILAGFDLSKKYEIPICINAGAGVFYRYPNNQQWIRHVVIQAGLSYIFRRNKE